MKEGRKPVYPEKTPGGELQKMPHTKARRFHVVVFAQAVCNDCYDHLQMTALVTRSYRLLSLRSTLVSTFSKWLKDEV